MFAYYISYYLNLFYLIFNTFLPHSFFISLNIFCYLIFSLKIIFYFFLFSFFFLVEPAKASIEDETGRESSLSKTALGVLTMLRNWGQFTKFHLDIFKVGRTCYRHNSYPLMTNITILS